MADRLNLGIMKPEYIARGQRLSEDSVNHEHIAAKATAMSRHPVTRASGRSNEFLGSARQHLAQAKAAYGEFKGLPKMQGEQFSGRSENFSSGRDNALNN